MTDDAPDRLHLLEQVRDTLPPRLNTGLLMGDGGFCILGWMLLAAGMHPITFYGSTAYVSDLRDGGPVVDVVARRYGLPRDAVVALARLNDETPPGERVGRIRAYLTELVGAAAR